MDGVVRRVHARYLAVGGVAIAGGLQERLDRLVGEAVQRAWAGAVEDALAEDPSVYVLRRVVSRHRWDLGDLGEPSLCASWGDGLGAAVIGAIASDPGDGSNLVQFDDETDYVAHFAADLAAGVAWSRWFYGAFAALRSRTPADALARLLLDDPPRLGAVLARLHRLGALERVLGTLGEPARDALWSLHRGALPLDRDTARLLLAAATGLAEALGLWTGDRDPELLERYLLSGPRPARWGDPAELAAGTWAAFRWLVGDRPAGGWPDEATSAERVDWALARLDWLDTAWLRERLLEAGAAAANVPGGLPVRPSAGAPTPRQRELAEAILTLVRAGAVVLDPAAPASAANALRLHAALTDRWPALASDAALPHVIQRLLQTWRWLRASQSTGAAVRRLRAGDVPGLLDLLQAGPGAGLGRRAPAAADGGGAAASGGSPADAPERDALAFAAAVRDIAADIVDTVEGSAAARGRPHGSESGCAGVLLLLRVLGDVRLAGLAARAGYPPGAPEPGAALTLAVGLRWAGPGGTAAGRVDPAVALLAGLQEPPTLAALGRSWSAATAADQERFEQAWLAVVAGHGLLGDGDDLHVYGRKLPRGRTAVVGAGAAAGTWPFGRVIAAASEAPPVVAGWLAAWQAVTGERPVRVVCDQSLAGPLRAGLPDDDIVAVAPAGGAAGPGKAQAEHRHGRRALAGGHRALRRGRLGIAGDDLVVELAAATLLRLWARWLHGFSDASIPYLLEQFVRRPGSVQRDGDGLLVQLEPRPLDVVLELAGYMSPLSIGPASDGRQVTFRLRRS